MVKSETFVCLYEDTLRFEIKVESRVTILYGDSGTGKTTFIECVTDSWDPDKRKDVAVLDYAEIDDPLGYLALKKNLTYVFIDEESANDLDRDELLEPILDAGYFLVIATRRPLLHLTYGLKDVFKLQTVDDVATVVQYYPNFDSLPKCKAYACEDSNSGYHYWSCFPPVTPMRGNRDWRNNIDKCLIMDSAALGNQIRDIRQYGVNIFLPESFEFLLLQHYCNYTHEDGVRDLTPEDKTFERLYTRPAEQEKALGFKYSKRMLPSRVKLSKIIPELNEYKNTWLQSVMFPVILKTTDKKDNRKELSEFLEIIGFQSEFNAIYDRLPDTLDPALWKVEVLNTVKSLNLY